MDGSRARGDCVGKDVLHVFMRYFSLKRASRSMLKQVLFYCFFIGFSVFWAREGLEVGPQLRAKLEVVLGGVLERCWTDVGRVLGIKLESSWPQDGPRWRQDGPSRPQDGARWRQDGAR